MKSPITSRSLAILAGLSLISPAFAAVTIDYVSVGYAGNAADPATGSLYGAVAYAYQIGKYEVTNAQYTEFLNAADPSGANPNGIYNTSMGSLALRGGIGFTSGAADGAKYASHPDMSNRPVNYVSAIDAARFANWLHNGQGSGSTETGSYTFGQSGSYIRNVNASVVLPTQNEWYKAAYYDPTAGAGGGDNYWTYATQSDTAPTRGLSNDLAGVISNPGANVANYLQGVVYPNHIGHFSQVGSAGANNFFGTFDQSGNVAELSQVSGMSIAVRGGAGFSANNVSSSGVSLFALNGENGITGFRVASISAVPEVSGSFALALIVGTAMLGRRKR